MSFQDAIWQFVDFLPGRMSSILELSPDVWFKFTAVLVLWVYMIVSAGHGSEES